MGVIDIKTTERNGGVVSVKLVQDDEEVMMVTQNGIMIRTPVTGIRRTGRNTQGVRLINVDEGDRVIDMTRVVREENEVVEGDEVGEEDSDGAAAQDTSAAEGAPEDEDTEDGASPGP
jgi:DNA gyrase subunit A